METALLVLGQEVMTPSMAGPLLVLAELGLEKMTWDKREFRARRE